MNAFQYVHRWACKSDLPGAPMPGYSRWRRFCQAAVCRVPINGGRHVQRKAATLNSGRVAARRALSRIPSLIGRWRFEMALMVHDGARLAPVHSLRGYNRPTVLRELASRTGRNLSVRRAHFAVNSEFVCGVSVRPLRRAQGRSSSLPWAVPRGFKTPRSHAELFAALAGFVPCGLAVPAVVLARLNPAENLHLATARPCLYYLQGPTNAYPLVLHWHVGWRTDEFAAEAWNAALTAGIVLPWLPY